MHEYNYDAGSQESIATSALLTFSHQPSQHINDHSLSTSSSFDDTTHSQFSQTSQTSPPSSSHSSASPLRPQTPSTNLPSENHKDTSLTSFNSALELSPAHGTKRTANGQVKCTFPDLPSSPTTPFSKSHSNEDSRIDSPSIAQKLQTRLRYAMIKVYNGWESRNFDEVEKLAAEATHPVSPWRTPKNASSPRMSLTLPTNPSDFSDVDLSRPTQASSYARDTSMALHGSLGLSHTPVTKSRRLRLASECNSEIQSIQPLTPLTSAQNLRHYTAVQVSGQGAQEIARPFTPTLEEQEAVSSLLLMSSPTHSAAFERAAHGIGTAKSSLQTSPIGSTFATPGFRDHNGYPSHRDRSRKSISSSSDNEPYRSQRLAVDHPNKIERRIDRSIDEVHTQGKAASEAEELLQSRVLSKECKRITDTYSNVRRL